MIRSAFKFATSEIRFDNIADENVIPVPLFEILDPLDRHDYVARVEPSSYGGMKMATKMMAAIQDPVASRQENFWKWSD